MLSSFPATGSFSRTGVNNDVGAKTPMSVLVTGAAVGLTLGVITPVFQFMPKTVPACIIISGVAMLTEFRYARKLWHVAKKDLLVW